MTATEPLDLGDQSAAFDLSAEVLRMADQENTCTICDPPRTYKKRDSVREHFRDKHQVDLPRRSSGRPTAAEEREQAPRLPRAPQGKANLETRFTASLATIGIGVHMWCPECGQTWVDNSQEMARAWCLVAADNDRARQIIDMLSGGGAWGVAIMTTLAAMLPMAAHHGLVPSRVGSAFGMEPHEHGPAASNGHTPPAPPPPDPTAGMAVPVMNEDGSMEFMGQHISAEEVGQVSEMMGMDVTKMPGVGLGPLSGASEVRVAV